VHSFEALRDVDSSWIEELSPPDDVANHAPLAAGSPIPIATGEL
jgi:L-alanine-DL-glutamate epimerase-like enolase superfamily enzyme